MPYTAKKTDKGYTVYKKGGGVVGHTGKTEKQKNAYMAALNMHSKDKPKKENIDGSISTLYMVKKPYAGCTLTSLVEPIDPLKGIGGSYEASPEQVHAVFPSQDLADKVANTLYEDYCKSEALLEKKKEEVTKKLKDALDELENQRSNRMKMIKENPKDTVEHKDKVAKLTHKIDDLMTKLEKIEKSKKEIEVKKDDKKDQKKNKKALKEGKFEVVRGKKPSGDPGFIVKRILSNDEVDKLSSDEQKEIARLKKDVAVLGDAPSKFKINAPTDDKPYDPEDESNWA
jgi:hypothetical protein